MVTMDGIPESIRPSNISLLRATTLAQAKDRYAVLHLPCKFHFIYILGWATPIMVTKVQIKLGAENLITDFRYSFTIWNNMTIFLLTWVRVRIVRWPKVKHILTMRWPLFYCTTQQFRKHDGKCFIKDTYPHKYTCKKVCTSRFILHCCG